MANRVLNIDERGGIGESGKPSKTIDEAAAWLGRIGLSWSDGLGEGTTVTYAFRASAPIMPEGTSEFSRLGFQQIEAVEEALALWSQIANITFVRVGTGNGTGLNSEAAYSNDATILFGNYLSGPSGVAAFAYFPGDRAAASEAGDIWINGSDVTNRFVTNQNDYGFATLLHEIGHAIGLDHPSDYNAMDGGTLSYAQDAVYNEDSQLYSVMSYFDIADGGGQVPRGEVEAPGSPLIDDIAAVQRLYGANMQAKSGDTRYGNMATGDVELYLKRDGLDRTWGAIWDAGGVDTLDFSRYYNNPEPQLIDLRAGHFSNVDGGIGNLSIAVGVTIENAIGGLADDVLIGNAVANRLEGLAGNDKLTGGGGNDVLIGGSGNDVLSGNDGTDIARFEGSRNAYSLINLGMGNVRLVGPDGTDMLSAVEVVQFDDQAIVALILDQSPSLSLTAFGAGGAAGGWSSVALYPRMAADVNGDGLADIVGFGDGGVQIALATGGGSFASPFVSLAAFGAGAEAGGWSNGDLYPRTLADVNGDGLADIVGFGDGGVQVALATGGGSFASPFVSLAAFGAGTSAGGWANDGLYPRTVADVDGDGLADIVGFGDGGVQVALATGGGSFADPALVLGAFGAGSSAGGWASDGLYPRMLADIDGDGLADIVGFGDGGVQVALATGGGSFAVPYLALGTFGAGASAGGWASNDKYPRVAADMNGDGRTDLVGFGDGGVYVVLANTDGSFAPAILELATFGAGKSAGSWTGNDLYPRLLADVTGDGRADILAFGDGGVFVAEALGPATLAAVGLEAGAAPAPAESMSAPALTAFVETDRPDLGALATYAGSASGLRWLNSHEMIV